MDSGYHLFSSNRIPIGIVYDIRYTIYNTPIDDRAISNLPQHTNRMCVIKKSPQNCPYIDLNLN